MGHNLYSPIENIALWKIIPASNLKDREKKPL